MEHSPERDEEVFRDADYIWKHDEDIDLEHWKNTIVELAAIAKKWRAKANMRAARIEELEEEILIRNIEETEEEEANNV